MWQSRHRSSVGCGVGTATFAEYAVAPYPDDYAMICSFTHLFASSVGYAAGHTPNPSYYEVCSGKTGHTEVVRVVFDPKKVSYEQLLKIFWESHDPTQGMRQGNDVGTQYRSGIYWHRPEQAEVARDTLQGCRYKLVDYGPHLITPFSRRSAYDQAQALPCSPRYVGHVGLVRLGQGHHAFAHHLQGGHYFFPQCRQGKHGVPVVAGNTSTDGFRGILEIAQEGTAQNAGTATLAQCRCRCRIKNRGGHEG